MRFRSQRLEFGEPLANISVGEATHVVLTARARLEPLDMASPLTITKMQICISIDGTDFSSQRLQPHLG